ncbi:MAG: hypothetical protein RLY14_1477 [Planctomycetota bacterium]|jgi:manganese/zinc/iron transport system permease protein
MDTSDYILQAIRVITLRDYNTRMVILGTGLLGAASGVIGVFLLLRKRALLGDAISHATLPGVAIAFLLSVWQGGSGKSLPLLLVGAALSGLIGGLAVLMLRQFRRIKEDTALGVVLSLFFGIGLMLLTLIQQIPQGHAAGLEGFIYGKTASMISSDALLIAAATGLVLMITILLYRPLQLLCFDEGFAKSQGWPVVLLDALLMTIVVIVTIVGLQAVGLILMISLLVVPAASSRFWTDQLPRMIPLSAFIATLSCITGATLSAIIPRIPSGAAVVLVAVFCFLISLTFGKVRGVFWLWLREKKLRRSYDREHILRDLYELLELHHEQGVAPTPPTPPESPTPPLTESNSNTNQQLALSTHVSVQTLQQRRQWPYTRLMSVLYRLQLQGLVLLHNLERVRLTASGFKEAERLTLDHRLWELYLMHHADVDPMRVDRSADESEHALGPEITSRLREIIAAEWEGRVPPSPHPITPSGAGINQYGTPQQNISDKEQR